MYYDCSGWATKAKTKCYDGLTIAPNAFQECDGKVVTMVYNHDHDNLENVLGHCLLENRPGGMYCYAKFNDTDTGRTAKACVENGDLNAFSIYANCIKKTGNTVQHGIIQEVSLVLAGCNPGALIDEVVKHSADEDYEGGEAFIYTDGGLSIAQDWTQTVNRWTTLYTAAMQRPTKQHRRKPRWRTNRRMARR